MSVTSEEATLGVSGSTLSGARLHLGSEFGRGGGGAPGRKSSAWGKMYGVVIESIMIGEMGLDGEDVGVMACTASCGQGRGVDLGTESLVLPALHELLVVQDERPWPSALQAEHLWMRLSRHGVAHFPSLKLWHVC